MSDYNDFIPINLWEEQDREQRMNKSREGHSVSDVGSILEQEGVGYALTCYMDSDNILDPKLAKLWDEAQAAVEALEQYIKDHKDD
jgi:hypothetical protein